MAIVLTGDIKSVYHLLVDQCVSGTFVQSVRRAFFDLRPPSKMPTF
jgi:hypothetical protein